VNRAPREARFVAHDPRPFDRIPDGGACVVCAKQLTRASWCASCGVFVCWGHPMHWVDDKRPTAHVHEGRA
jgi:hypothetical protein